MGCQNAGGDMKIRLPTSKRPDENRDYATARYYVQGNACRRADVDVMGLRFQARSDDSC